MKPIPAFYDDGVFRPDKNVSLPPGARVHVIVLDDTDPTAIMREKYPNSFGILNDEDADELRMIIKEDHDEAFRTDR